LKAKALILLVLIAAWVQPQTGFAVQGNSPENNGANTGEPAAVSLSEKFKQKGLLLGAPVFLRIYKSTSEIELWVQQGPRFVLAQTYGICRWSGLIGPKMTEGDRQSPEGLYHITAQGLIANLRWHRAMRLNYPNSYDVTNGRTGSGILIHGKCHSVGCFAIEDGNVEEVYEAVDAAFKAGQARIPVLSLPFRFGKLAEESSTPAELGEFWTDLRHADLMFNRDRIPPAALLCNSRYYFVDRRGDERRHFEHPAGCQPFDKPVLSAAATAGIKKSGPSAVQAAQSPEEAAEETARTCNSRDPKCRLLRVALTSHAPCPHKYARCRTAQAAYTKSADCPLKYPRCRWFMGPEPRHSASLNRHRSRR